MTLVFILLFINCVLFFFLFPKVQSHLGGLIASVSELEEQQKQRAELGDWIQKQQSSVNDWLTRPCKLRPEAAKQELVNMNDLLSAIGDKRSQLMLDMTGSRKIFFI